MDNTKVQENFAVLYCVLAMADPIASAPPLKPLYLEYVSNKSIFFNIAAAYRSIDLLLSLKLISRPYCTLSRVSLRFFVLRHVRHHKM